MNERTQSVGIRSVVLALTFGLAVAFVFVPLLGISSAIAAPKPFFDWARSAGVLEPTLFAWQFIVIGGLGMALPALIALIALWGSDNGNRAALLCALFAGILIGRYWVVPAAYHEPPLFLFDRGWWSYGQDVSLVVVAGLGLLFQRLSHDR